MSHSFTLDLVVIHPDRPMIEKCQELIAERLNGMGLELKPRKTRITHTLSQEEGEAGFNFLGFNIRQYPTRKTRLGFKTIIKPSKASVKRHQRQIAEAIDYYHLAEQTKLIRALNPIIQGWSNYFSTVCSKKIFSKVDKTLLNQLRAWSLARHPNKSRTWTKAKYWKTANGKSAFSPRHSRLRLRFHSETRIKRHAKVQGNRSPYESDWMYWSARLGQRPGVSTSIAQLLKRQQGKCPRCGLYYKVGDVLEKDHIIPKEHGGKDAYDNWQLLHRHCHDAKTAEDRRRYA